MPRGLTYAFKVCVHGRPVVEVLQSANNIRQLKKKNANGCVLQALGKILTNLSRLVSGHAMTKSAIVPCSIHSEIITRVGGENFAPTNCNRFGCLSCFHRTTSRQNSYPALISTRSVFFPIRTETKGPTFSNLAKFPEFTRRTFIATPEPWYTPRHTSALPPPP